MEYRTVSSDLEIRDAYTGNIKLISGARLVVIGILSGSVDVGDGCTFILKGMMHGDLVVSPTANAVINGTLQAKSIDGTGRLVITGIVNADALLNHADIQAGAIVNGKKY